ncbi:MAG: hypothetical protein U9Q40_09645, partial [Campylobacterota bacterium]|nr:hypothetical protein [Campylobacterota bacterium]
EIGSFDSLTSTDLKLALNEEVEDTQSINAQESLEEQEIQGVEALENLLEILKDKNILASMKGQKININITIGEE